MELFGHHKGRGRIELRQLTLTSLRWRLTRTGLTGTDSGVDSVGPNLAPDSGVLIMPYGLLLITGPLHNHLSPIKQKTQVEGRGR